MGFSTSPRNTSLDQYARRCYTCTTLEANEPKGMRNRNAQGHSLSPPSPIDPTTKTPQKKEKDEVDNMGNMKHQVISSLTLELALPVRIPKFSKAHCRCKSLLKSSILS